MRSGAPAKKRAGTPCAPPYLLIILLPCTFLHYLPRRSSRKRAHSGARTAIRVTIFIAGMRQFKVKKQR
jgi:hypothetical protein